MLPDKTKNFSEWYVEVIRQAELADYAPIQGCIIFRPNSYAIWENIQKFVDSEIKKTGHRNAYFPLLIPEKLLKKEAEHFAGFTPECAWVTRGGNTELEEPLAIRPTSETIMYTMFKNWVQSHRDLPILLNQWCSVVRWETKATKPFLRTREFLWQEGHTAHVTKEQADMEVKSILEVYRKLLEDYLAIPVIVGVKSEREKFAGALYTTTVEAMMPDGKALQAGTSHNLGQHFSKVFDITFLDEKEQKQYAWQTSWGVSTRLIGALIMAHGDNKGLIIPPRIAATKAVIIPIYFSDNKDKVMEKARELRDKLSESGIETFLDSRENYTPGYKFNDWELKGVPLRVEVGPKDIEKKQAVMVRRDNGKKVFVKEEEIVQWARTILEDLQKSLFEKAKKALQESIREPKDYKDFYKILEEKGGFLKAGWCGNGGCEDKIKEETGATIRAVPFEDENAENCIYCGKGPAKKAYFARAY